MSEPGYIVLALSRLLETWDRDNGPVDIGLIVTRAREQYDKQRQHIAELERKLVSVDRQRAINEGTVGSVREALELANERVAELEGEVGELREKLVTALATVSGSVGARTFLKENARWWLRCSARERGKDD